MADPLLRLIDINKSYPGVRALSRVSLTVNRGEVLALIGENGAGKSTLMKILGGVVKPDQGTIEIESTAHESLTVSESLNSGIAFVHQELNLFDNLDVGANVLIGREPLSAGPLVAVTWTLLAAGLVSALAAALPIRRVDPIDALRTE